MKTIWRGTISFGLVSIPVNLYSAIKHHAYGFELLHDKCDHPIHYHYWCEHCKKTVEWQSLVKGLKLRNGRYIVLTKEKIAQLKPEKSDSIDIIHFVDADEISALYIESHYYLAPSKEKEKAFFLFKEALEKTNKVAIGHFVMHNKEYVCTIAPYDTTMILNTLNYAYEIRDVNEISALEKQPKISTDELALAKELIAKITKKKFDITEFKDTYIERLKKAIEKAKKTGKVPMKKIKTLRQAQGERGGKTLVGMLQKSLKESKIKKHKPTGATVYAKRKF